MNKYIWITGIFIVVILALAFKQAPKEPSYAPAAAGDSADAVPAATQPVESQSGNIKVTQPRPESLAESPLLVKGQARAFEATFQILLKDADNKEIVKKTATYTAEDPGQFGDFGELLLFDTPKTDKGTLEVFTYSAKDGAVQDLVSIPVKFK